MTRFLAALLGTVYILWTLWWTFVPFWMPVTYVYAFFGAFLGLTFALVLFVKVSE